MPFTVSHAAAVLPLSKWLGHRTPLSALIIGSLSPDFPYFLRLIYGGYAHTLPGVFLVCLPLGLLCYGFFHIFCKRPATALLPESFSNRLAASVFDRPCWPNHSFLTVTVSLVIGAFTHIGWDAFTHVDTPITSRFTIFQAALFSLSGQPFAVYKLLQHLSSIFGLLAIAYWLKHWMKATAKPERHRCLLNLRVRCGILMIMVVAALVSGAAGGLQELHSPYERQLFFIVTSAINGGIVSFIAYGCFWHLCHSKWPKMDRLNGNS